MSDHPPPWQRRGWFADRGRELIWTSLSIPVLAFWISLGALIYVAVFTTRPTVDLQLVVLGLAGVHAGRRVADNWVATKAGNGGPIPSQPAPSTPQGRG